MARPLPALSALAVLGLVGIAAAASSDASDDDRPVRTGSFGTVPAPAAAAAVGATTTTQATDRTVPRAESLDTVPDPGILPGFDGATFDDRIAGPLLSAGAQAVSIAVAKDGRLIHTGAYGIAVPAINEVVTPDHRFRIASNSKMITATVVLQLVDQGALSLDDRVLPRIAAQFAVELGDGRMNDVTVRQLLDHTSGFEDFQEEFFREQAVGCEDVTVEALRGRLSSTPGRVANYSNLNFCALGLLIEQVTGDGYQQAVQDRLLTPLGITDMRVTGNDDLRPGEVVHQGGTDRNFMEVLGGAGAWVATAADMVTFLDSLDTNRPGWHPLSAGLATEMRAPGEHVGASAAQWLGLGMRVWRDGSWGHTGTIQNAHSMVLHQPDGYTWAVLVSGDAPADSDDLREYVARAFRAIDAPTGPVGPFIIELPPTTSSTVGPTTVAVTTTTTRTPATTAPRRPSTTTTIGSPETTSAATLPETTASPPPTEVATTGAPPETQAPVAPADSSAGGA